METAKVTEISRYSRERRQAGGFARTPLDECREQAVIGLKNALAEGLERVQQETLRQAEKTTGSELYHLYMDALELVRDQRGHICEGFRTHFLQWFNLACRRESGRSGPGGAAQELSLVEPDDLEQSLAAGTLANAIYNGCAEELFGLDKRIGMLINDPDMLHGNNPLGPEVIADALNAALDDEGAAMRVRLLLIAQLSRELPGRVREVYRGINQSLVDKNVLPTIRVGLKRGGAEAAEQPAAASGGNAGDVFAMLRQLMAGGAGGQGGGIGVGVGGSAAPIAGPAMPGEIAVVTGGLLHDLGQLQRGQVEVVSRAGIDPSALGDGRVNILHGLRSGGMAGSMGSLDAMTLDIVAMVFDYILDDSRIPDAMKALIGRLQIPVLKVAMLDKTFFSHKSQPARRLLDALAEAAIGWDTGEGHQSGLYRKVEELVEGIIERFDDKIEVFESALADLQSFLSGEQQEAAVAAAASVQAVKLKELTEQSLLAAHDEVQSSLIGQAVPAFIVGFLGSQWQRLLAEEHVKSGGDSASWKTDVQTMADLVWSVQPKLEFEDRRKLLAMLPGLLSRLDGGIARLGLPQQERDRFFSDLVKCHAEVVKAGIPPELAMAEDEDVFAIPGIDSEIPRLSGSDDFEAISPATVPAGSELIEELVAPVTEMPPADVSLEGLKRGSWIAYREDDGREVRARLSWVSPMQGIYLFTNRHGQRAISINADGLRAKLADGSVRILNDAPLMDRAVGDLMEKLQRNAA